MLTQVHRQARDNPIVRLSMAVREGVGSTTEPSEKAG
jgi:exodeoxyribonuclease-5